MKYLALGMFVALGATVTACSTREPRPDRWTREQREGAERERSVCAMVDHCDMGLLDIDQQLATVERWANESCVGLDRWSSNLSLVALRAGREAYVDEQEIRAEARHLAISRVSRAQHCAVAAVVCDELMRAIGHEARAAEKEVRARRRATH